jgi:hypothetical protein
MQTPTTYVGSPSCGQIDRQTLLALKSPFYYVLMKTYKKTPTAADGSFNDRLRRFLAMHRVPRPPWMSTPPAIGRQRHHLARRRPSSDSSDRPRTPPAANGALCHGLTFYSSIGPQAV